MINLDSKYQQDRNKEINEQNISKKLQINVNQSVQSALNMIKQNINKNYHLQENLRKHLLSSSNNIHHHKFEIEQIYSKDNTKSQLKHQIPFNSLNLQRRKLRNTMKQFNIDTDYDFSEEKPLPIFHINPQQNYHYTINSMPQQQKNKIQENSIPNKSLSSIVQSHPSSANPNSRSSNFFITNPQITGRISSNSFKIRAKDKTKTQTSNTSDTQYSSPTESSRATISQKQPIRQPTNNDNLQIQIDNVNTSPYINPLSTTVASLNNYNLRGNTSQIVSNHTNITHYNNYMQQQNTDQDNISLLSNSNKNLIQSSNNFLTQTATLNPQRQIISSPEKQKNLDIEQLKEQKINETISKQKDTINSIHQDDETINKNTSEMNEEENEEDITYQFFSPQNDIILEEGKNDDSFFIEPKQYYYIDNNEMQSVKEFMYRVNNYEQFKRFEQSKVAKSKKSNQIKKVQQLLLFISEKAAREVAKANVRKYIMKHKIRISDEEVDKWVEKIKVLPIEQNQRLTFRESNRQIISFQLMGTDQDKQYFKMQRELGKALNKINKPIKFIQQYQIHQNNKAKNYHNYALTQKQLQTTIINQLPSKYLVDKPPASFFKQSAQSMNRLKLKHSFERPSMNQIHNQVSKIIELSYNEEDN